MYNTISIELESSKMAIIYDYFMSYLYHIWENKIKNQTMDSITEFACKYTKLIIVIQEICISLYGRGFPKKEIQKILKAVNSNDQKDYHNLFEVYKTCVEDQISNKIIYINNNEIFLDRDTVVVFILFLISGSIACNKETTIQINEEFNNIIPLQQINYNEELGNILNQIINSLIPNKNYCKDKTLKK